MKIQVLNDETVYEGRFIRTIRRHFLDTAGKEQIWEMVQRKTDTNRIVSIAAITTEGEILVEKIYRLPFKGYTLELPAGLLDKDGEHEKDAARRELLEETGYAADTLELLTEGPFNTGLTSDVLVIYLAINARKVREAELEGSEDIEVIKVPLGNLFEFLKSAEKNLNAKPDMKIAAIIPHLQERGIMR